MSIGKSRAIPAENLQFHKLEKIHFVNFLGKKLGHRRVGDDGEVTYKKFETTQLIGSIQLGLQYSVGSEVNIPDRDLLFQVSSACIMADFRAIHFTLESFKTTRK